MNAVVITRYTSGDCITAELLCNRDDQASVLLQKQVEVVRRANPVLITLSLLDRRTKRRELSVATSLSPA